ncbi:PREDICTED: carbohydrate sulfotransferase 11-like [Priapulus caudatus]|uniref:Carbohydrate sulfotransferase n=1 Tax=Priapulus caudatus TaxID=37621 RepID=A0ABM1E742_PRICU|nr:PREDICTED: carbohydrate sulfotransferase 11-like [Priapulus caudatus]XP_014668012.1 PREDICTED: carbohydrate sulfotransferase 11-like [Priapulus caudatus]XP_014668013.1 PREDICTED: carbohydrate sulfotransferase 11-like [Priapulus caudatus]
MGQLAKILCVFVVMGFVWMSYYLLPMLLGNIPLPNRTAAVFVKGQGKSLKRLPALNQVNNVTRLHQVIPVAALNQSIRLQIDIKLQVTHTSESRKIHETPPIGGSTNIEDEQKRRKARINQVCRKYNMTGRALSPLNHLIVDDPHHLLYCYVPKVACTNWKRVMLQLAGDRDASLRPAAWVHARGRLPTLARYAARARGTRAATYTSFLFARHPFERLLSAFRNKFESAHDDYFRERYGREIVRRYRENATREALRRGHDVTFAEFARFVGDPRTRARGLNEHWASMFSLCRPCELHYSVVGKYETLAADARFVLQRAHVADAVRFPLVNASSSSSSLRKTSTRDLLGGYMVGLSDVDVARLRGVYAFDFEMFGYEWPIK